MEAALGGGPRRDMGGLEEDLGGASRAGFCIPRVCSFVTRQVFFFVPRQAWVPSSHDKFVLSHDRSSVLRHVLALLRLSTRVASVVVC